MKKQRTYISFDPNHLQDLDLLAKKLGGVDRADIVRMAVVHFISYHKKLLKDP